MLFGIGATVLCMNILHASPRHISEVLGWDLLDAVHDRSGRAADTSANQQSYQEQVIRRATEALTYHYSLKRILLHNLFIDLGFAFLLPGIAYFGAGKSLKQSSTRTALLIGCLIGPVIGMALQVLRASMLWTSRTSAGFGLPPRFWWYAPLEILAAALFVSIPCVYYWQEVRRCLSIGSERLEPGYPAFLWTQKWGVLGAASILVLAASIEIGLIGS